MLVAWQIDDQGRKIGRGNPGLPAHTSFVRDTTPQESNGVAIK